MEKRACRPTCCDFADFYPKNSNIEKNNVVAEIFNAGSENSFESNITSRQTQTSPESHMILKMWVVFNNEKRSQTDM